MKSNGNKLGTNAAEAWSDRPTLAERGVAGRWECVVRLGLVIVGLGLWFFTQWLISGKGFPEHGIGDAVHTWTAGMNAYLLAHDGAANGLLIVSSTVINILAVFVLGRAIFGPSLRPFVGLVILFGLRQICQSMTALPAPEGMIWREPGFPGGLVTYGVSNDLFFSGHTAIAVFGAVELARLRGWGWKVLGVAIALFEVLTVLVLRAHYTMDVFTGIVTALGVQGAMAWVGPRMDQGLARLMGRGGPA